MTSSSGAVHNVKDRGPIPIPVEHLQEEYVVEIERHWRKYIVIYFENKL